MGFQLTFLVRYVVIQDISCRDEERFITFQEYCKKTGSEIAQKIAKFTVSSYVNFDD